MGRRAKKAPVVTKKRVKLSKRFKCPFCANDDTVECKMDHKAGTGSLTCRLCGASFQMPIHHLNEPIDVFSEWLDECEAAQNPNNATAVAGSGGTPTYDEEEEEDALPESSGLGQRKQSGSKPSAPSSGNKNSNNARSIDLGDEDSDDDE